MTSLAAAAAAAEGQDPLDLLQERNIFDSHRGRRAPEPPPERVEAPRVQFLALTGTMNHGRQSLAFFGSSEPSFQNVASPGDRLGEFTVAEVTTKNVVLELASDRIQLAVGGRLERVGDGPWQAASAERPVPPPAAAPAAARNEGSGGAAAPGDAPGPAPAGNADELIRQMMQRREQEVGS